MIANRMPRRTRPSTACPAPGTSHAASSAATVRTGPAGRVQPDDDSRSVDPAMASAHVGNDVDGDLGGHLAVDPDRDSKLAKGLDRFRKMDLAAIDLNALALEQIGDLAGRHGTVERFVLAHLLADREANLRDP